MVCTSLWGIMPVMDGFEATQQIIRMKKEGFVDASLPIIALTANAMEGDRDKCIKVGMDDYLSKPVRSKDLIEKIVYWSGKDKSEKISGGGVSIENKQDHAKKSSAKSTKAFEANISPSDFIDEIAVKKSQAVFKSKYKTILDYFIEDAENYIHQMRSAIEHDTPMELIRPAHTLKSTSKRMGAVKLSDAACLIEQSAKSIQDKGQKEDLSGLKKQVDEMYFIFEATKSQFFQNTTSE